MFCREKLNQIGVFFEKSGVPQKNASDLWNTVLKTLPIIFWKFPKEILRSSRKIHGTTKIREKLNFPEMIL